MPAKKKSKKVVSIDSALYSKYQQLTDDFNILSKYIGIFARIAGKTIVIKCGNDVLSNRDAMYSVAQDIAILQSSGVRVILVHGGGAEIGDMIKAIGCSEKFIDGERVVEDEYFHVVEMVLTGSIAPRIVSDINHVGGVSVSVSGRDSNCIKATKLRKIKKDNSLQRIIELGHVGEPTKLNIDFIETVLECGSVPVISPIGISEIGKAYIINADTLAGFIAEEMEADLLIFLTDHEGIKNNDDELIESLSSDKLKNMINKDSLEFVIKPKAEAAVKALKNSVESCSIINGHIPHAILLDLLNENGIGTVIFPSGSFTNKRNLFPEE